MMAGANHVLVLGGQRSGKSRTAEALALKSGRSPILLATATPGDSEMAERIAAHRARRGEAWRTVEEPLDLPTVLAGLATPERVVVVDCLTLWLSNLMHAERNIDAETDRLVETLQEARGPAILVSNEVGLGIIPANALARRFVDAQGILNQRVAAAVGRVIVMAAGIPLQIKPPQGLELAL
jgi:adenosylcobinamide kinase/adenosylcobinamide-phosphate guanylyltransferase